MSLRALAEENWHKPHIQERYGSSDNFYEHLPLADRLSGVVHMATGTGKSFTIFAIAYLSLAMGLAKRVLVLGPQSMVIEKGLRDKFKALMEDPNLMGKLPAKYRKPIALLTDNDAIEDNSIVIENINATYTFGGILDTFFKTDGEVLVLSDEIHHAYSHLRFTPQGALTLDVAAGREGRGDDRSERLWMRFLRENAQIKRHLGFTGTPYNADDYFSDVVFNYSIKTAIEEQYIKKINPLLEVKTEDDNDGNVWTPENRFRVVMKNHETNHENYSYAVKSGRLVKPITLFICNKQDSAINESNRFVQFLAGYMREKGLQGSQTDLEAEAKRKVICVVSRLAESEYRDELEHIEEADTQKTGGLVEFIFAVNKLTEGWDVDNVFQIVPMEEKVFQSKLLISQVIGRGLRIPRKVPFEMIRHNYPMLTITNHERFATHIRELMDAVVQSDMSLASAPLPKTADGRGSRHFTLFNLNYLPTEKVIDAHDGNIQGSLMRELILTPFDVQEEGKVVYLYDEKRVAFVRPTMTSDFVVDTLHRRFRSREHEGIHFDFGAGEQEGVPSEDEISNVIEDAMARAGMVGDRISELNRKQIDLYFNQFLPRASKRRVLENIAGEPVVVSTESIERSSVRLSELDRDAAIFFSEEFDEEVDGTTKRIIDYLRESRIAARKGEHRKQKQTSLEFVDPLRLTEGNADFVRTLVDDDPRSPFFVNASVLKTPQSAIILSHTPERQFLFHLLDHSTFVTAWVKSPDKGFYSLNYEYWKGGRDRVRRGFNPDFFIVQNIREYVAALRADGVVSEELRKLEDDGITTLIRVVEIKSDDDDDEAIEPKIAYANDHFAAVNEKLKTKSEADFPEEVRDCLRQHYTFDLLRPNQFQLWFKNVREGRVKIK